MYSISIPQKVFNMNSKWSIIKENKHTYSKATKKLKSSMIDQLQSLTNYSRKHVIRLLSDHYATSTKPSTHKRGRKKTYPEHLGKTLLTIWKITGQISSFHLHAFVHENLDIILQWDELKHTPQKDLELISQMYSYLTRSKS